MGISDISGRPLPISSNSGSGAATTSSAPVRTIAVPLIRLTPNESSQELVVSAFGSLPAATAAFTVLTDAPTAPAAAAYRTQQQSKVRIESMLVFCPDMVADVAPYLFIQLEIGGQPANAWGNIPIFPRAGVASVEFDVAIYLAPDQPFRILARNTDAANEHFVGVYLRGWFWPKDYVDG